MAQATAKLEERSIELPNQTRRLSSQAQPALTEKEETSQLETYFEELLLQACLEGKDNYWLRVSPSFVDPATERDLLMERNRGMERGAATDREE